jgi:hypothetical protein
MIALGFIIYALSFIPAIIAGMTAFIGIGLNSKLIGSKLIMSIWFLVGLIGFVMLVYGLTASPIDLRYTPNLGKALCSFVVLQGVLIVRIAEENEYKELKEFKYFMNVHSIILASLAIIAYLVIA